MPFGGPICPEDVAPRRSAEAVGVPEQDACDEYPICRHFHWRRMERLCPHFLELERDDVPERGGQTLQIFVQLLRRLLVMPTGNPDPYHGSSPFRRCCLRANGYQIRTSVSTNRLSAIHTVHKQSLNPRPSDT